MQLPAIQFYISASLAYPLARELVADYRWFEIARLTDATSIPGSRVGFILCTYPT
jgi:hypothetical protein